MYLGWQFYNGEEIKNVPGKKMLHVNTCMHFCSHDHIYNTCVIPQAIQSLLFSASLPASFWSMFAIICQLTPLACFHISCFENMNADNYISTAPLREDRLDSHLGLVFNSYLSVINFWYSCVAKLLVAYPFFSLQVCRQWLELLH